MQGKKRKRRSEAVDATACLVVQATAGRGSEEPRTRPNAPKGWLRDGRRPVGKTCAIYTTDGTK